MLSSDALSYGDLCLLDDYAHLLSLYWNKEEFQEEWHILLQKYQASEILARLKSIHEVQGLALHSVSKVKRQGVFSGVRCEV
ncbi:MAG: DUF4080 domain-containing protein [Candidatus Cloacimonetes bacterium]|nr:DUF4080 domain-containing protein [Candidatus Cloacimonadota bacterium]